MKLCDQMASYKFNKYYREMKKKKIQKKIHPKRKRKRQNLNLCNS